MHGLGADGHDFEPIVAELELPETLALRFVFPHAPMRPVTINRGYVMRAWYDVVGDGSEDAAGIRASQARVEALGGRGKARASPPARVVLAGFSPGGAMALHTGLRHPERLAGIIPPSCHLPPRDTLPPPAD